MILDVCLTISPPACPPPADCARVTETTEAFYILLLYRCLHPDLAGEIPVKQIRLRRTVALLQMAEVTNLPARRAVGFCWIVVSRSNKKTIPLRTLCLRGEYDFKTVANNV